MAEVTVALNDEQAGLTISQGECWCTLRPKYFRLSFSNKVNSEDLLHLVERV